MKLPLIHDDVANWWYHYYSKGENSEICKLAPKHFALSDMKCTPDFEKLIYDWGICHPQIGDTVTEMKSIVLVKTTVGSSRPEKGQIRKSQYIVGYFRVGEIDKKKEIIRMILSDSLLLLNDPIKLDSSLAKRLFPYKPSGYWDDPECFVRRVGSTLRNKKATVNELKIVLAELVRLHNQGARNFLGKKI